MSTTAFYNFTCKISLIVSLWVTLALTFLGNNFHKFKLFSVLNCLSFLCFGGVVLDYKTTLIRVKPQYWTIEMNKLITWTQNYQFNCANYLLSLPFSTFQLSALNHRWIRCLFGKRFKVSRHWFFLNQELIFYQSCKWTEVWYNVFLEAIKPKLQPQDDWSLNFWHSVVLGSLQALKPIHLLS